MYQNLKARELEREWEIELGECWSFTNTSNNEAFCEGHKKGRCEGDRHHSKKAHRCSREPQRNLTQNMIWGHNYHLGPLARQP